MKQVDYRFTALLICTVLGWSLQQVLHLTWPQFDYISGQIKRLQYWRAKNEVFFGVAAAFGDKEDKRNLFDSAGDVFVEEPEPELTYTQEELAAAMAKLDRIRAAQAAKEQEQGQDV